MIAPFTVDRLPRIRFGRGAIEKLPHEIAAIGRRVLIVTGRRSFQATPHWADLPAGLGTRGIEWWHTTIEGEPSPDRVDTIVAEHRGEGIDVVVGIGGGSALDAAKAVAGLLPSGDSVMDYLEGVGAGGTYRGPALPYIAAPTTAGTGSEATKNAVLSRLGPHGFKKSFRDGALIPQIAIVDPALLEGCPATQMAANAMDALTQLIESYTSSRPNTYTAALVHDALPAYCDALPAIAHHAMTPERLDALSWGSLVSGIALAHTGLGAVHGLASPLGAQFPIPHGVACGTLLAEATAANLEALKERAPNAPALARYGEISRLLGSEDGELVTRLREWCETLDLPRLSAYGITTDDLPAIIADARSSSMQTNPIELSDAELTGLLVTRL